MGKHRNILKSYKCVNGLDPTRKASSTRAPRSANNKYPQKEPVTYLTNMRYVFAWAFGFSAL